MIIVGFITQRDETF